MTACAALLALVLAAPAHAATASPRVVGGSTVANPGWVALLRVSIDGGTGQCDGQLVAKRWVLTAAHCVVGSTGQQVAAGDVRVWVGLDRVSQATAANAQAVEAIAVDPRYNGRSPIGDLALLRLAAADAHEPVAVGSDPDPAAGTTAQVLGWGVTNVLLQQTSDTLQQISTPILDAGTCSSAYGADFDAASMICAGGTRNQDSCGGDSGGPLATAPTTGAATLLGTVDYGSEFCGDGSPSVYQRVTGGPGAAFLAATAPAAGIATSPSTPARDATVQLTATSTGITGATFRWDLDGDGVYDDATGTTVPLALGSSPVGVGVRAAGSDGEQAARRMTLTPAATTVTASVARRVTEGTTLRIRLGTAGPGSGTVTARVTGDGAARDGTADVPRADAVDVALRDDRTWQPPRLLTITLSGAGGIGLAQSRLTTTLVDDDRPVLRVRSATRRGTRTVATTVRAPGAGTVTVRVVRGGRALARRTVGFTRAQTRQVTLTLPASRAAQLRPGGASVRASWRSRTTPVATATASRRLR